MTEQHTTSDEVATFSKEKLLCEIGEKLQQARHNLGLSKESVVKELKFSKSFLTALESGDWSEMPGEVYALGFFRQYAELLDIDITTDIQQLNKTTYVLTTPLTFPDAPISPNRTWVIISILLFLLIIIVGNLFDFEKVMAPVAEENSSIIGILEPEDSTFTIMPQLETKALSEPAEKTISPITQPPISQAKEVQDHQKSVKDEGNEKYTFLAASDAVWLQVYQKVPGQKPKLLREALLKKGKSFSLDSHGNTLLLTSGNAFALQVSINGKTLYKPGSLGKKGVVLRRFLLKNTDKVQ